MNISLFVVSWLYVLGAFFSMLAFSEKFDWKQNRAIFKFYAKCLFWPVFVLKILLDFCRRQYS